MESYRFKDLVGGIEVGYFDFQFLMGFNLSAAGGVRFFISQEISPVAPQSQ
jgi:hypothetical protein